MDRWAGLEIRHLAALTAVEREGTFRAAADSLGYVQSAVSQQISQLEQLVGRRLVERSRGPGRVALTESGKLLLKHADRVLQQLQAARADLQATPNESTETLRVGTFESVAARVMPSVLRRFAARRPGIQVSTIDAPADASVFAAIAEGKLDATFAELPPEDGPYEGRALISDPCVLVVARDNELADIDGTPTLAEIAAMPLVAHPAWRMTALIDAHFAAAGLAPEYRYRSDNNVAIQALVSAGLAAAIMARLAVNDHDPGTRMIELDALPRRAIGLYWHSGRVSGRGLDAFVETVEATCRELYGAAPADIGPSEAAAAEQLPT